MITFESDQLNAELETVLGMNLAYRLTPNIDISSESDALLIKTITLQTVLILNVDLKFAAQVELLQLTQSVMLLASLWVGLLADRTSVTDTEFNLLSGLLQSLVTGHEHRLVDLLKDLLKFHHQLNLANLQLN